MEYLFQERFLNNDCKPKSHNNWGTKKQLAFNDLNLYRPRGIPGFNSLFIENKILVEYLKCDVKPWKYPKTSNDKVELEPLPTDFLPPIKTTPILFPTYEKNGKAKYVVRVCGYREIFKKRQYIQYLRDKENDVALIKEQHCKDLESRFRHVAPGGGRKTSRDEGKNRKSQQEKDTSSDSNERRRKHNRRKSSQNKKSSGIPEQRTSNKSRTKENRKSMNEKEQLKSSHRSKSHAQASKINPNKNQDHPHKNNYQKSSTKNKQETNKSKKHHGERSSDRHHSREEKSRFHSHDHKHQQKSSDNRAHKRSESRPKEILRKTSSKEKQKNPNHTKDQHTFLESKAVVVKKTDEKKSPNLELLPKKENSNKQNVTVSSKPNKDYRGNKNANINYDINNNPIENSTENNDAKEVRKEFVENSRDKPQEAKSLKDNDAAHLLEQKLNAWIQQGNSHRVKAKEVQLTQTPPQQQTLAIIQDQQALPLISTIQQDQTAEKIAEYFRKNEQTVFTAATNKTVGVPKKDDKSKPKANKPKTPTGAAKDAKGKPKDNKAKDNKDKKDPKKGKGDKKSDKKGSDQKQSIDKANAVKDILDKQKKKKKGKEPVFDITDFQSYFKFVYGMEIKDLPERDSEWLQVSDTDSKEDDEQIIYSFDKPMKPWMLEGISYESQTLVEQMDVFYWVCLIMGRQFFYVVPNFLKGHMEFATQRIKMIPFFISAFILWASLVLICQSYAVIYSDDSNKPSVNIEQLEATKYSVGILFVMANLGLAAIWSVIVVLRDGTLITHYLNCWCAALAEMETSGALEIRKLTYYNLIAWLLACIVLVICFAIDRPANVRGTAGLVSMLLFRGLMADIRLREPENFIHFQVFGLIFILYVLFCARMLFAFMQMVSLIIKNTAEMWNLKFALAFKQLMLTNRGQLARLSLNVPIGKFFSHHRIITALLKIYGEVFGIPIMIYMIVQIGVITYTLVALFNFKPGMKADYGGTDTVLYDFYDKDSKVLVAIKIPYYHTPVEEVLTMLFALALLFFDFLYTTEIISLASQSFFDGFEFVRRTNLILCENTHQRRLIQSLLWSMSETDASLVTANSFFPIGKPTVVAALGTSIFFFSLIIQLQSVKETKAITFQSCNNTQGTSALGTRCSGE